MTENHFLAINTSSGSCSAAVSKHNIILNSKKIVADKGYSELMLPLIDTLLKESNLNINKLIEYLNNKNYFGEQYHNYKNLQIDANKWWFEKFIK